MCNIGNTQNNCQFLNSTTTFPFICDYCTGFTAVFTTLGMIGRTGPVRIGNHYTGQDHDGQVTLSSGIQQWTVTHTGEYRIEAIGASGGTARTVSLRTVEEGHE